MTVDASVVLLEPVLTRKAAVYVGYSRRLSQPVFMFIASLHPLVAVVTMMDAKEEVG